MSASDTADEWSGPLDELARRRSLASRMGGPEAIAKHKAGGRLTARERIDALLDAGSFRELGRVTGRGEYDAEGKFTDLKPVNAIIGTGRIEGRKITVTADDYTLRAGSSEATLAEKWVYAERMALDQKMPLVRLVDTAGGSVKIVERAGHTKIPGYATWPIVELMRAVPVCGVALGSCAGLGAIKVLTSHFSVMVRGQSQVFAAGPPVVKQAYGIDIDKNTLGGHEVHRKSALVYNEAEDEQDALGQVRRFLSYLPRNAFQSPARAATTDDPARADDWLRNAVPRNRRKVYDPRRILAAVFDRDSVFELGRYQGGSLITALARLDGWPVGVLAGDPRVAGGALTVQAAWKMERHTTLCDTFGLPIVHFVDQPGNATGLEAELAGTLLGALRVMTTIERSRVPWVSIMVRRAFGVAGGYHMPHHYPKLLHRFAWPSARWGSLPVEGGVAAAYRSEIAAAPDPEAKRREIEGRYHELESPFRSAEQFGVVDVIDPRETRGVLTDWVEDAYAAIAADRAAAR